MKTLFTAFALMACVCANGQTNFNWIDANGVGKVASQEFVEIQKVFEQMRTCATNSVVVLRGQKPKIDEKKFISSVGKIDTGKCPKDFRLAWEDLVFASEERLKIKGSLITVLEMAYLPTAAKGLSDAEKHQEKTDEANAKLREAVHEIKKIVIKYSPD